MSKQTIFKLEGPALASRQSASKLRADIESVLEGGEVTIDLSSVSTLSESYADELIGVLVAEHSLPWVFERVELRGATPAVSSTLVSAIKRRLSAATSGSEAALEIIREAVKRHRSRAAA